MTRISINGNRIKSVDFENGKLTVDYHGHDGDRFEYSGPGIEAHYNAMVAAESPETYFRDTLAADPAIQARRITSL